jgi:hypothetical protein
VDRAEAVAVVITGLLPGRGRLQARSTASPYFSTWGPSDGPILGDHEPPALGVVTAPGEAMPVGVAFPGGHVAHRKGPATTVRLVIGQTEPPGRWFCPGEAIHAAGGCNGLRNPVLWSGPGAFSRQVTPSDRS